MSARPTAARPIGLLGPLLPQRGGIAQHTTMLHRALRGRTALRTVGLARGYPLWLYPGHSNLEPGYAGHREPGVDYLVDPLAPRSWLRAVQRFDRAGVGALLVVWWNVFWAPAFGVIARALRQRGTRLLYLCHNVVEHESTRAHQALSRAVLSLGDGFVVHTAQQAADLEQLLGPRRVAVSPHPVYEHFPPARGSLPRRARLELLFFGFVRRYKGLDLLARALQQLGDEDLFLTVAGEWWHADGALRRALQQHPRVEVLDRYLDEQEVAELFARADAVVLPYRSVTGTGVVPLAYRYGKPVIATDLGGLSAAVIDGVSGLLVPPRDADALAAAIRRLGASTQDWRQGAAQARARMTWGGLADTVLELAGDPRPPESECV